MFKDIPQAIQITFWKHLLLSLLIAGFGAVWSIAVNDRVFTLLTILIVLLSVMRLLDLLRMVRRKNYCQAEGVVLSDKKIPLRRCHVLTMQLQDGGEVQVTISGSSLLKAGEWYRIYLLGTGPISAEPTLPHDMMQEHTLLGADHIISP